MKKSIGARSLAFPTPVFVIGTYDTAGKPNAMTAAWAGICCSKPPCIGVSLRKATYTYGNIVNRKAFTVNISSERYVKECDYFGMATGKNEDKFAISGLTAVKSDRVDAPYLDEFPFALECRLLHSIEIGLHTQFIGEIMDIRADDNILGEKGIPDIEKVKPILYAPEMRTYYGIGNYLGKAYSIGKDISG